MIIKKFCISISNMNLTKMLTKRLLITCLILVVSVNCFAQNLKSPAEFLGYKLGEQFTPYYRVLDYVNHLAGQSANIKVQEYGKTYEGRPLNLVYIASDENIKQLDEIRHNNLKLAGIENGNYKTDAPAIIWFSYNVHGNEPSSTEVAMRVMYELVNPANESNKEWLKNLVVIIDPCLNPDGRERYTNFYNSTKSLTPNPSPDAREHLEPWPSGRTNHYYFDLNRDWAWQTQIETQQRLAIYNQWLPQVHVDFHENGADRSYYFPPAAEPYHQDITTWQRDFQAIIGNNHARHFDQKGWSYFTKEEYDLVYPSYGDTYPTYNGAIGMTYEQSGINAGISRINADGDTLTLTGRIEHHFTTSISTLEVSSKYASKLISEFKLYFDNGKSNPPGQYKTYIIKEDNQHKLQSLATLLKNNGILFGYGFQEKGTQQLKGYNYFSKNTENFSVDRNDMVISTRQPKSVLLKVLMEPETYFSDSITYDITAWSLPYARGLQAYALKEAVYPAFSEPVSAIKKMEISSSPVVYLAHWNDMNDVKFLTALLNRGIKVQYSEQGFSIANEKFGAGSLIVSRSKNLQAKSNFDKIISEEALKADIKLTPASSGMVNSGLDLGSGKIHLIKKPRIAVLSGSNVNPGALGEIWHFFEQTINFSITIVNTNALVDEEKLADYTILILPDGTYDETVTTNVLAFAKRGGKVIALNEAVSGLSAKKELELHVKEKAKNDKNELNELDNYNHREASYFKELIPGAIYKVHLDNTHPLGFGFPPYYFTLKTDARIFNLRNDGWNVGVLRKDSYVTGLVGSSVKTELLNGLIFGVQNWGNGSIVYLSDDPLYRSFWETGKMLFSNALFMVGY